MSLSSPVAIHPLVQRTEADCVHTCIAMICQVSYLEVTKTTTTLRKGLSESGAIKAAERVGVKLLKRQPQDLEDATGILWSRRRPGAYAHAVVIFQGVIVDPATGIIWDLHAYLKDSGYKVESILVRED